MSHYTEDQTHQVSDAFEEHGFTPENLTALGQNTNGVLDQLKLVLMGLATIVRASFKLALDKAFSSAEFIGKGWSQEDCVEEPGIIDFEQIVLETHLREGETSIRGEEKMKRAKAGKNQQLGGRAFFALWNDWQSCKSAGKPEDSVLEKLRRSKKIGNVIYFFGMTLRAPNGHRSVLYLCFGGEEWDWDYVWLGLDWGADAPSASLASVGN